ncbi:MAG: hypothetical protein DRP00_00845 [Candidatus Aenigmatarchaeota archaeon]|nr:MAG: hypothetical protein DRP00_00845 [Candidatus Aenigmarchaeota archaeon]
MEKRKNSNSTKSSNKNSLPTKQIQRIIDYLKEHGDLTIVSAKGHGKTNLAMVLAQELAKSPENHVIIFESFPKWINEFGSAKYLEIEDNWIIESQKAVNLENLWLIHDTSYAVYGREQISEFLRRNKDCIFLVSAKDLDRISYFVYSVIYRIYRRQYDLARKGLELRRHFWFILEEAQNSLDRHVLSRRYFNRFRKLFSEARNLNLHFILITQRLQDLNTYFRARTSLAVGKIGLDDFDLKLRRLLKPVPKAKQKILSLQRGVFYFTCINEFVKFPKFVSKPAQEFKPTSQKQPEIKPKQGITSKIKSFLSNIKMLFPSVWLQEQAKKSRKAKKDTESLDYEPKEEFEPSVYDEDEEFDSEIEEDGLIYEDLFGEDENCEN